MRGDPRAVSGEGRGRKEGVAHLPILIPVLCDLRLLVVLGSEYELPSRKPPLEHIGWSAVSEVYSTATAKSSPSLPRMSLQFGCPIAGLFHVGVGGRPRLLASPAPLPAA